jgi:plasmid stability protein
MAERTVTIALPDDLYDRLERRAAATRQSIADEVLQLLAAAVPAADERLPSELEAELARMEELDDVALQRAARSSLAIRKARRLESLHFKVQAGGLTEAEQQDERALVRAYQRALLIRAQALALLKQRGQDISSLLARR